jgi:hypothetical protein
MFASFYAPQSVTLLTVSTRPDLAETYFKSAMTPRPQLGTTRYSNPITVPPRTPAVS